MSGSDDARRVTSSGSDSDRVVSVGYWAPARRPLDKAQKYRVRSKRFLAKRRSDGTTVVLPKTSAAAAKAITVVAVEVRLPAGQLTNATYLDDISSRYFSQPDAEIVRRRLGEIVTPAAGLRRIDWGRLRAEANATAVLLSKPAQ
jgi:hypothetical protein